MNRSKSSKNKAVSLGNTSKTNSGMAEPTKEKKQVSCAKHWCFTYNNPTEEGYQIMVSYFRDNSSTFECVVFQEEMGEEQTPHLQGALTFVNKGRPFNLGLSKKIHWEKKSSHSTLKQQRDYCCRPQKRALGGRVFLYNWVEPEELHILMEEQLYPWQRMVINEISCSPNDRNIIWVCGRSGLGKTQFAKYLVHHFSGVPLMGSCAHVLSVVAKFTSRKLFIFLATMEDRDRVPYKALECVKDGLFMSHFGTKGTRPVIMNSPHVIVFANYPPREGGIASKKIRLLDLNFNDMEFQVNETEDYNIFNQDMVEC